MAVKEMKNYAIVEGIVSEIGLEKKPYTDAQGREHDSIRGEVAIRVVQEVEKGIGEVTLDVPIRFFVRKLTNAGNENPAYTSLEHILENGKSIAVVGEDEADCVRITGANVTMQEYYAPNGRLISFPSISGSFINPIRRQDMVMKANFDCEVVINTMDTVKDKEGVEIEPKTLQITGIHVGYGEYTNIIPFLTRRADIGNGIQNAYSLNDTITLSGKINFSSRTETYFEPVEIGDPVEKQRTIRVSELLISGVAPRDMTSEEYDVAELKACLASRTARLEASKAKAESQQGSRTKTTEQKKVDVGF